VGGFRPPPCGSQGIQTPPWEIGLRF